MDLAPIEHITVWIREDKMIQWSRSLGFDGWDARDAAHYIQGQLKIAVYYHQQNWAWFMQISKHKEWFLLQHGDYFL